MKFIKSVIIGGLACLSLAGILGSESSAQTHEFAANIYLENNALDDFKKRVEIGKNCVFIRYPAKGIQESLEVKYIDFDEDSKIDMYSIVLFESKTLGKRLSTFWNEQFSDRPSWGEVMGPKLQNIIDKEYQNLREKSEIPGLIHLEKKEKEKFEERKHIIEGSEGLYTILRVSYPPYNWPYLQIEYYSEDNEKLTVRNYEVRIGSVVLAEISRKDMSEEMRKEIDQQYRALREK